MARRVAAAFFLTLLLFPAAASGAIRVEDDSGRIVLLPGPPRRVVSLYAGHSENLLALGAGGILAGVSSADDATLFPGVPVLPERADGERILALNPDLVLIRPRNEASLEGALKLLERSGVPVASLAPPTRETIEIYLARIGALAGVEDPERIWREKTEALKNKIPGGPGPRPTVFFESSFRGLLTCSPSSWAAYLIDLAGGVNAASEAAPLRPGSPLAPWGEERLLVLAERGLDVYLVQAGPMNPVSLEDVLARPWISGLGDARIAVIPEELVSRPSLLRLEEGVERLRQIFYPEGRIVN